MISPAVAVIARFEWQRRWRGLVALALIAGLFGGAIIAGAAVARRTASAPRRLLEQVHPGDAHLQTIGDVGLAEVIAELPAVSGLWASRLSVGKVHGDAVVYLGVIAEQQLATHRTMPFAPVVVAGRMYDDDAADEIVLREDSAAALGVGVDDTLSMSFLTPEEIGQFDTGFGEPDGPTVALRVVGLVRVPSGVMDGSPAIASPAFAAAHPEIGAGNDIFVELVGGSAAVASFTAAVDEIVATRNRGAGSEDFPPVQIDDPGAGTARLENSSRILIGGLLAALIVAVIAALVVCGQAWSRHFAVSAAQQQVESALGLDARARLGARLVPAVAAAAVAAGIAATVGLVGSAIEPLAGLGRVEPDRGWRVDGPAVAVGASAVIASSVVLAALAVMRAGRRHDGSSPRRTTGPWRFAPRRGGWPLAGAAFARSSGDAQRSVPVTMSLAASVLGVGGLVGALIFSASLHRLTDTPARYGWRGDVAILDVNDDIVAELVADPRVASVADVVSSTIRIGNRDVSVYAFTSAGDELTWSMHHGRLPVDDDEVVIGSRLAQDLEVEVGDRVDISGTSVTVAGIGLGPPLNGEPLGSAMLFSPAGLRRAADVGAFREALVRLVPGTSAREATTDLGARYELTVRELPPEVRRIADLGSLPIVLGSFLAGLAAVALAHALAVTARRRARDLAVLRAIGSTPGQAGLTIITTSVVTVVVGIVIGVPVGWSAARLVWGELARSVGVRGDVLVPGAVGVAVAGALCAAIVLATPAAINVGRRRPGEVLQAE